MPPRDTEDVLIRIAGDIGQTRAGIDHLKEGFKEVKEKLDETVKQITCDNRHEELDVSLSKLKLEIVAEIKRSATGEYHRALTPEVMRAYQTAHARGDLTGPFTIPLKPLEQPLTVGDVEAAIEERKEEKAEKKRKAVTFWLASISAGVALLSGCAIGIYKLVSVMNKLETVVTTGTQEVRSEMARTKKQIVYVDKIVTVRPDGGVVSAAPHIDPALSPKPPRRKVAAKKER